MIAGVAPPPPRLLPSTFWRIGFNTHGSSIFHRVLLTRALALSASQLVSAQEKVPRKLYEYALGGIGTHEIYLYQARENNLTRHRGSE